MYVFASSQGEEEEEERQEDQNEAQPELAEHEEDEGAENNAPMDQNRIQEGLMALFQQMRGRERNEEAGEDREVGDEVMEDFLQMLLRQRPPARPPPASPIDEQAYACAKAGDLEGFKRCLASGTPRLLDDLPQFGERRENGISTL